MVSPVECWRVAPYFSLPPTPVPRGERGKEGGGGGFRGLSFRISRYGVAGGIPGNFPRYCHLTGFTVMSQYSIWRLLSSGAKRANSPALTPSHRSSPPIATDVGSALQGVLPPFQPAHG